MFIAIHDLAWVFLTIVSKMGWIFNLCLFLFTIIFDQWPNLLIIFFNAGICEDYAITAIQLSHIFLQYGCLIFVSSPGYRDSAFLISDDIYPISSLCFNCKQLFFVTCFSLVNSFNEFIHLTPPRMYLITTCESLPQ